MHMVRRFSGDRHAKDSARFEPLLRVIWALSRVAASATSAASCWAVAVAMGRPAMMRHTAPAAKRGFGHPLTPWEPTANMTGSWD